MKEKMKRLHETRIKEISAKISSVVFENIELKKIYENVANSHSSSLSSSSSSSSTLMMSQPLSHRQTQIYKAKLSFRLARVILLLRKLINACNKKYISEDVQFRLLANTMLRQNIFNRIVDDESRKSLNLFDENDAADDVDVDVDVDDLIIEFEILGLTDNNNNNNNSNNDEHTLRINDSEVVEDRDDENNDENDENDDDDDEDDDNDDDLSYSIILNDLISNQKSIKSEYFSILSNYATKLNNAEQQSIVEYKEDMVSSIEQEVETIVGQMRVDYPDIDKFVQDIYLIMAKEWLSKYEDDELLKGKYRHHQQQRQDENGKNEKDK
jgi:hypothetical protein